MNIEPTELIGKAVRLSPLRPDHVDALAEVGLAPQLWTWVPTKMECRDDMEAWVLSALKDQANGLALPFVIIDRAGNKIIGGTRYGNIDRAHKRLEIGWTWLAPAYQRTAANTEAKFLLLSHAFETLGANRVELKTDVLNEKSRNAILRIGAVQEGIFRKHMVTPSGRIRDSVYFSIIDSEWPKVKSGLLAKIAAFAG